MLIQKARILKGIGSFYYVETSYGIYECKARGILRQKSITPFIGDIVDIEITSNENKKGIINNIYERKNYLIRPPVSNIDNIIIVSSLISPKPNILILDKLILICEYLDINPFLIFTKKDIVNNFSLPDLYIKLGFEAMLIDNNNFTYYDKKKIIDILNGKISILIGNSGVGKSTLINKVFPDLNLKTNNISKKLGRGKHTTRHTELFYLENIGYIADTPGFSSLDISKYIDIKKEDLKYYFREFNNYNNECKFKGCSHIDEQDCKIINLVNNNYIPIQRYNNYIYLYNEYKKIGNKYK